MSSRQRRFFGSAQSGSRFLQHDALVERALFQVASADRSDLARREEDHLAQVRQEALLAVLEVKKRIDAA